ncbi:MAG: bifunctional phosphoribosylaminoimidazolecarboxamide formyltransferase/IMP cyclohydrolase [Alphaproteobacteria bacterium]
MTNIAAINPIHKPVKKMLVSVSDKKNLSLLADIIKQWSIAPISTGGSRKALEQQGLAVEDVAHVTGFPEMMDGRVKTLHPHIHGAILGRRDIHMGEMQQHGIAPIDLVVVNLYPFVETVAGKASFDECVEQIDIGGPALIRAAAKNHEFVTIITSPEDYAALAEEMQRHQGQTSLAFRRLMAAKAYAHTAAYDAAIAQWFATQEKTTPLLLLPVQAITPLRYGENPHQQASFYQLEKNAPFTQIHGKELSYNNILDVDAAWQTVQAFSEPTAVIVKHNNPCGIAEHADLLTAFHLARRCDPVSAFGGIIAVNRPITPALASEINKGFVEVVIAPAIEAEAITILESKKNQRVLLANAHATPPTLSYRSVTGGLLVQDTDKLDLNPENLRCVTKRQPTAEEWRDLLFAFKVAAFVKSNAIIYAKDGATVGIGAGQMSRVDSARIAAWKAEEASKNAGLTQSLAQGSVAASDAFFPFADGLLATAKAGVTAIIQPGGSIRDQEVIDAADAENLAMIFTGRRHFRH